MIEPVAPDDRIPTLDALRGAALYGVLLVNVVQGFRVSLFAYLTRFHTDAGALDHAVDDAIAVLVEQKAMVVFSFLFGVGLGIQRERVRARGGSAYVFLARRYAFLLVLGLLHLVFVWSGDILAEYAVAALLVVPLSGLPPRVLAAGGIVVLAWWVSPHPPPSLAFPSHRTMTELADHAATAYGRGTLRDVQAFRFEELRLGILPLLAGVLPRTIGSFLLGAAAGAAGVVREPPRRWLVVMAVVGTSVGGVLSVLDVLPAEGVMSLGALEHEVSTAGSLLLGIGYAATFALAMTRSWFRRLAMHIAPVGRMALTNYLAQSFVGVVIFYGIGLGAMNRIGSAAATALATAIFALQAWLSTWWLRRRRFGPVEWLWRRLTYGAMRAAR